MDNGVHAKALGVVVLTLALAALVGCGCGGADEAALDGTQWRLVRWSFDAYPPTDFTITAAFDDGQIAGAAAVNGYGAPYTTGPDDTFSVGDIVATEMAGPRRAMEAEEMYFELLEAAASYALEGDAFVLYGADGGEALVFEAI